MSWKNMLKRDKAIRRREEEEFKEGLERLNLSEEDKEDALSFMGQESHAQSMQHYDERREKRKKMGLPLERHSSIKGREGTPRSKRPHRMKEEDKPKPRRRATEKEQMETRRRNRPPIMGDRGSGFRGH